MTPHCEYIRQVGAYHDGELPVAERSRLEGHMRGCPDCVRELERLKALSALLSATPMPVLAGPALERLHRRVARAPERVLVRMGGALTAVAASVLVACSMWLWQTGGVGSLDEAVAVPMSDWERAALGSQVDAATASDAEVQIARWIVEDLSQENGQ